MSDKDTVTAKELLRLQPYLGLVRDACAKTNGTIDPFDWAALGFRESGWGWGVGYAPKGDPFGYGDGGHGFGLFQIDDRWNAHRIRNVKSARAVGGDARALVVMITEAIAVLLAKRTYLSAPWRPQPLTGELLRRASFAAYNAGEGRVYRSAAEILELEEPEIPKHLDHVDEHTTGGDYSSWVTAKSAALRAASPCLFDRKE